MKNRVNQFKTSKPFPNEIEINKLLDKNEETFELLSIKALT